MKYILITFVSFFLATAYGQNIKIKKLVKVVAGVSYPEFLHAGATVRISNRSMVGCSAGVGVITADIVTSTVNFEHRLYFGKNSEKSNQKVAFFRQGISLFPAPENDAHFGFDLTIGKDFVFNNPSTGITVDAGILFLPRSKQITAYESFYQEKKASVLPAFRVQFYF